MRSFFEGFATIFSLSMTSYAVFLGGHNYLAANGGGLVSLVFLFSLSFFTKWTMIFFHLIARSQLRSRGRTSAWSADLVSPSPCRTGNRTGTRDWASDWRNKSRGRIILRAHPHKKNSPPAWTRHPLPRSRIVHALSLATDWRQSTGTRRRMFPEHRKTEERYWRKMQGIRRINQVLDRNWPETGSPKMTDIYYKTVAHLYICNDKCRLHH